MRKLARHAWQSIEAGWRIEGSAWFDCLGLRSLRLLTNGTIAIFPPHSGAQRSLIAMGARCCCPEQVDYARDLLDGSPNDWAPSQSFRVARAAHRARLNREVDLGRGKPYKEPNNGTSELRSRFLFHALCVAKDSGVWEHLFGDGQSVLLTSSYRDPAIRWQRNAPLNDEPGALGFVAQVRLHPSWVTNVLRAGIALVPDRFGTRCVILDADRPTPGAVRAVAAYVDGEVRAGWVTRQGEPLSAVPDGELRFVADVPQPPPGLAWSPRNHDLLSKMDEGWSLLNVGTMTLGSDRADMGALIHVGHVPGARLVDGALLRVLEGADLVKGENGGWRLTALGELRAYDWLLPEGVPGGDLTESSPTR